MKWIQKYIYWAIATALLGAIVVLGFLKSGDLPRFYVTGEGHTEVISTYNAKDGNYYVFLPAYADLEDVTVDVPYFQPVTLNGIQLMNGMDCGEFLLETPYELHYKRTTATLWFYQSANVATMYINTASGTLDRFHKDKAYEEGATVTLYTADGSADCLEEYTILKGRGNGTWGLDKRPYSLTMSSDIDLMGMGSSSNWILLANAYDETNLNNKLVLDLAKQAGISWSPDSAYVDVYLNGQYNGLYLLTEKVEVGPNRLEIDVDSGDFLGKVDLLERWDALQNPFETETGRIMEITTPKALTAAQTDTIQAQINQLEQIILSGTDLDSAENFDLDSWVRRYLMDEISGNIDSDLASSYFYCADGTFYAGPIWDYDMAFGNNTRNQNPHAFIAKNAGKSEIHLSSYYPALYSNPIFYQRMTEIYRADFLPVLERLLQGGLENLVQEISTAARINSLRWGYMYEAHRSAQFHPVQTTDDVRAYLDARVSFLNQAWLENREFCTLQFELVPGEPYWNISVEKGTILQTDLLDIEAAPWICRDTGAAFDPKQPITGDLILTLQQPPAEEAPYVPEDSDTENIPIYAVCLGSIVLLLGLFLTISGLDILHRHKERRRSGERKRTKVSP